MNLLAGILLALSQVIYTTDDTHVALAKFGSVQAECVVRHESDFNPYAVGDHGTSFGAVQLHSPGKLDEFYAEGWGDPNNPYAAVAFLQQELDEGWLSARAWSPIRDGSC